MVPASKQLSSRPGTRACADRQLPPAATDIDQDREPSGFPTGRPQGKHRTVRIAAVVLLITGYSLFLSAANTTAQETWVLRDYAVGRYNGTESGGAWMADVIRLEDGTYRMYYGSMLGSGLSGIRYAESSDGVTWTVRGTVLEGSSNPSDPEYSVSGPSVLRLPDGRFRMYYQSSPQLQQGQLPRLHVRSAISSNGVSFTREGVRINITAYDASSPLRLAGHGTYFRASNGTVVGIFSGEFATDPQGPSDLKMATSSDGLTFSNFRTLYSDWHDPIVVQVTGGYRMYATYLVEAQGTAASTDGLTWPSSMTSVRLVDANNNLLTEENSGVGDIGGLLLPSGAIRLFTNYGNPSENIVYFEGRATIPGAPTNLRATVSGSTVTLAWTAPTTGGTPTSYVVEVGSSSGASNVRNVGTGSTAASYAVTGLGLGTYYARVRARNSAGTGLPSSEVTCVVGGVSPPGAPRSLTVSVSDSTVTFTWGAPATGGTPTTYVLQAGSSPGASNIANFATGSMATSYTATGVPSGTYYVRVLARNSAGTGPSSNEVAVRVGVCSVPPGPPTGLTASVRGNLVTLTWNAPTGGDPATSYLLEAGAAPGSSNVFVGNVGNVTSLVATAPNGTFYARVKGVNACGTGAASNEASFTVP